MLKRTLLLLAIALSSAAGLPAWAQDFPTRTVKVIVPYPPGGPLDVAARILAPRLATQLRQPVILDNKSGAAGAIGVDVVAKAVPDGYTLLFTVNATLTINPHTSKALPYDPLTDFTPIATVVNLSNVLVVNPQVPVNTVAELVSYAKRNQRNVTFSSAGVGALNHLAGELLKSTTGAPMLHVPYKGNAPAMTAVISGEVTFMFDSSPFNYIRSGKVRPLAVSSVTRKKLLPDLPTMIEAGIPGYEVVGWYGFLGPAHLPEPITSKFIQALKVVMSDPAVKEQLQVQGFDINLTMSEDFAERIKTEYSLWGKVVREANIGKS